MGKINVYDKIMIENQKKRENMEIKFFFYINLHSTGLCGLGWNSQIAKSSRADVRGSANKFL